MRPKKMVLCVDTNPLRLSVRVFLLETRGFSVLRASSFQCAVDTLELYEPGQVYVLIVEMAAHAAIGAQTNELIRRARLIDPEISALSTRASPGPCGDLTDAEVYLEQPSPAELVERVSILASRKRGPKKKPVAGVPAAAAYAARGVA
ncbi:MAG: response regulator [Acidobacteriota bacterium]|nr:response regulator [Acidobacteriota bacterium]